MEQPKIWGEGFRVIGNKGFHIKFENNVCVSVQFGPGNYCEHYVLTTNYRYDLGDPLKEMKQWESKNAEVAIWYECDEGELWITDKFAEQTDWAATYENFNIQVLNNVNPKQVLEVLNWAKKYKEG